MTGLQDIAGARVVLGGTLYKVVEIAVGENFAVIWPNPFGGSGAGGDADSRFFDEVLSSGSVETIIGARALYDLYISQTTTDVPPVTVIKNISEILRHFSLQTTGSGSSEQQYIQVDIGFAGLGFGSFGGVAPGEGGGGGGTGGSSTLEGLDDTTISSPASGQILIYNNDGTWHNTLPTLDTLSNVAAPSPSQGQALIYNNGTWVPGNVLSAVELAQGTANGTLRLKVNNVLQSDVSVPGLKALAFRDTVNVLGTASNTTENGVTGNMLGVAAISYQRTGQSPAPGSTMQGHEDWSFIEWDEYNHAWHFHGNVYADGWGSFGGINSGSGSGSGSGAGATDLDAVWASLKKTTVDSHASDTIHLDHIPLIPVSKGGTGLSSITQYALLIGNGTSAVNLLSPNTAITKKFLTMTGTGSAGANPQWNTLETADISDLSSWTGSSAITTLGTIETGVWQGTVIDYDYIEDLFIGTTEVQTTSQAQALTGITDITASGTISSSIITASTKVQSPKFYLSDNVFFELDANNNVHLTSTTNSNITPGFYADGFGSFGGLNSGSGGGGGTTDLSVVWNSLKKVLPLDEYANDKIHTDHIPLGNGLTVDSGNIKVNLGSGLYFLSGAIVPDTTVVRTEYLGGLKIAIVSQVPTIADSNTLYIVLNQQNG